MNILDGLDSVKIGCKVILALAGERGAADTWHGEGSPESQIVNVLCVLEKHVYLLLSVFK